VVALVWGSALELVTPKIAELDLEVLARVHAEAGVEAVLLEAETGPVPLSTRLKRNASEKAK